MLSPRLAVPARGHGRRRRRTWLHRPEWPGVRPFTGRLSSTAWHYGKMSNHKRHNADYHRRRPCRCPSRSSKALASSRRTMTRAHPRLPRSFKKPDSNLASMGIYIFNADPSRAPLKRTPSTRRPSTTFFGKNIISSSGRRQARASYTSEFNALVTWAPSRAIETSMDSSLSPPFDLCGEDFSIMSNAHEAACVSPSGPRWRCR